MTVTDSSEPQLRDATLLAGSRLQLFSSVDMGSLGRRKFGNKGPLSQKADSQRDRHNGLLRVSPSL